MKMSHKMESYLARMDLKQRSTLKWLLKLKNEKDRIRELFQYS